jgi:serine/threonine protein kinase
VKKIKVKSHTTNAFKEFERELTTLIRIKKHQNLVSLIAISKKADEYYLLIDFCEGGNLFELLHRRTDIEVPWRTRLMIAKQVAVAMNYLHNCQPQIIHRDLKSLKY